MGFRNRRILSFALLLSSVVLPAQIWSQSGADDNYQARRQKAYDLFSQGKRLEALPMLEDLVKTDPKDADILVALAACLIEHANTLTDQNQATAERSRAKDLLENAWNLGNTSPMTESLLQLLGQLPKSGEIQFSSKPEVQKVMLAGEAAFSRRDFDEALKDYAQAMELEPTNYAAALFTANTYDKKNDYAKAAEWYERTGKLDPNIETAFRYHADMLAKEGDMAKARAMMIHAAVAEPYNRIVWRELHAWATINKTDLNFVYVGIPPIAGDKSNDAAKNAPNGGQAPSTRLDPGDPPEILAAWKAYHAERARWRQGGEFKKHFPQEADYRHSLSEESAAQTAACEVLQKVKDNPKTAALVSNDSALMLLLRLYQAHLIDAYVLFSLGDEGVARDYSAYRAKNREKLEEYMDKFVVPAAPAGR